jgi:hypothetical protein
LIKQLGSLRTPASEQIAQRRRAVLADAVAWGWDESQIRELVKSGPYLAPVDVKNKRG